MTTMNSQMMAGLCDKQDRHQWRNDPCDPRYVSIEKIYYANGNSRNCKGCGALIEAGDGTCPYCDRGYSP